MRLFRSISHVLMLGAVLAGALLVPARQAGAQADSDGSNSPFGMVVNLANRVRSDEQPAMIGLMREAGIRWSREEISWDKLQPERGGPYRWGGDGAGMYNYDRAIALQREAGINLLGLLAYNPAWFKSKNPTLDEWLTDWGDYVYNVVARYGRERGHIKYWEVWNEPNLRPFGYEHGLYTVREFVRMLDVAQAAIKAADPGAVVVLGGVANIWGPLPTGEDHYSHDYLRMIHAAGGWHLFDILALHPYRAAAPELVQHGLGAGAGMNLQDELREIDRMLGEFGRKPVWLTEIGWSTSASGVGVGEAEQAAYLQRMHMLALSYPFVQRIFWYDLRNDTAPGAPYDRPVYDAREPEFHYGLLRRSYPLDPNRGDLRKPAFVAYRTMTEILGGLQPSGTFANGDNPGMPGTFGYRYEGGGRAAVVLWRIYGGAPTVTIQCNCRDARVRQWDGKLLAALQTEGTLTIRLEYIGAPLFVEWGADRVQGGRYFPETDHHVTGAFLRFWNEHDGLRKFGFPITGPLIEPEPGTGKPRRVQYFERNRFEHFPEARDPKYEVQIARLGDDLLRKMGIDWTTLPRSADAPPECLLFPQTGHRICPPFRDYWERNGGLSLFGMPLTDSYDENGVFVQYFERNRFEHHPDKAGTPSEIQLGLLGRLLYGGWSVWP